MKTISVIDSHTGGEPTRIVVANGPDLGSGTLAERASNFAQTFDSIRTAVIAEPRGSEVMVGGLLCEPNHPEHTAGVIFFDNAGLLGMCGHGTIGLAITLHYMGRMPVGIHKIETPVGVVEVELVGANTARITNVRSYRLHNRISVDLNGYGTVVGDVVWGGNWFFLTDNSPCDLRLENSVELIRYTKAIRKRLVESGQTGIEGAPINHIEIYGAATKPGASAKNFVLCPGGAYDRSPCGTGTSAKLACLAADGKLQPGEVWRQESIVGSIFECSFVWDGDGVIPTIQGNAHVCAESKLILDAADPFCYGILE